MMPITDPNLISQLEGTGGPQPVTDPALIAQLEGNNSAPLFSSPVNSPNFLNLLNQTGILPGVNPAITQGISNVLSGMSQAGMGLANAPHNIANLISPQTAANIPTSPINTAQINQSFGTQNPTLAGKLLQGVGRYAPYAMGGGALGAAGIGGDAAVGGAYGLTQSPNPIGGGIGSAALAAIPGGLGLIGKGAGYLKPGDYADQIVNQLSGGRSLEENAQSLAQDVKNSFDKQTKAGSALYQPIFNKVGNNSIYEGMQPANSSYQSLGSDVFNNYDTSTRNLHQQFLNDPSFQNAHNLQSQLGSTIRQTQEGPGPLLQSARNELQAHQSAQGALQSDMNNFLNSKDPNLANQYQAASQNWATKVAPYYENNKINSMAQGNLTNPINVANIFKSPEPAVQQVVGDLPDDAKNKILYSMLGKTNATASPQGLVKAFTDLDQKGLSSYVPQTLQQQISSLGTRIKLRNASQMGIGGALGLMGAKSLGDLLPSAMLEPLALGGGAMLGRGVGSALQKIMPNTNFSLANSLRNLSPAFSAALIPHLVGGQ